MKKILSAFFLAVFISGSFNLNAKTLLSDDPFDECLNEAEADYSITGDLQSAIDVYNECVDNTLEELEHILD